MRLALLASVLLIPVAAALGYVVHRDPPVKSPPTLAQSIRASLRRDGKPHEQWIYVVSKGKLRGNESDAVATAQAPASLLKDFPGRYVVRTCSVHSTSGRENELFDPVVLVYCKQRLVTRAEVLASRG